MGAPMRFQPQGLIRLNRSNPLTRGLVAAYVPRSGLRDATGTLATISDVTPTLSPFGYITPPLGNGPYPVVGTFPFTRTDPISAFVLGRFVVSSDANTAPVISVGQAGGANGWKFGPLGTGGNLDLTFSTIADYATTVPFPAIGSIAFSATPGANARIFTNGVFRQQIGVGTPNGTLATARMAVGQRGDAAADSTSASQVALALYWNRALSDAEQASLAANPWQIFDAGSSGSAYQAAIASSGGVPAGSPNSFTYSASGGFVFSGAAPRVRSATKAAAGGLQLSGAAPQARGVSKAPAGGILLAGTAPQTRGRAVAPAGGLTLSGASSIVRSIARAATGGLKFAGAAALSATAQVQARVITPVGGLLLAGAAAVSRATSRVVSGGLTFSGHAVKTAGAAGALVASLLPIFRRRRR